MERVGTLLQKLQAQYEQKMPAATILVTVQQIQAELIHLQQAENASPASTHVAVVMPNVMMPPVTHAETPAPEPLKPVIETPPVLPVAAAPEEERTVEILQVDEDEIAAELEEIKRNAEAKNNMSLHNKPVILFEETPDIPTLTHQEVKPAPKEINDVIAGSSENGSLNDKLRQGTMELGDQLSEAPIRDLKKAIGINDRFLFINDLFRGDETMYERSIKTINGFSILPEAEYWIQRELKVKLGWDDRTEAVKQFAQLIKRRFS